MEHSDARDEPSIADVPKPGTELRRQILTAIAGLTSDDDTEARGATIQPVLESYHGEMNHTTIYQNLDALKEAGFVVKDSVNGRTDRYELTAQAREFLRANREWEDDHLNGEF